MIDTREDSIIFQAYRWLSEKTEVVIDNSNEGGYYDEENQELLNELLLVQFFLKRVKNRDRMKTGQYNTILYALTKLTGINNYPAFPTIQGITKPDLVSLQGDPGADGNQGVPGPQGPQGIAGADGAVWRNGTGVPANTLGIDGDYYIDVATSDVYERAAGVYNLILNIQGAQGIQGLQGVQGLQGIQGIQGIQGENGWTPQLAIVTRDATSEVLQLTGWIGGTGATPSGTGFYLGPLGLVANINDAVNLKGSSLPEVYEELIYDEGGTTIGGVVDYDSFPLAFNNTMNQIRNTLLKVKINIRIQGLNPYEDFYAIRLSVLSNNVVFDSFQYPITYFGSAFNNLHRVIVPIRIDSFFRAPAMTLSNLTAKIELGLGNDLVEIHEVELKLVGL